MKKGLALEKLVAHLESALIGKDNLTITSPRRLRDVVTGRLREHDVILEIKDGHHINWSRLNAGIARDQLALMVWRLLLRNVNTHG
jgi:hypothetical protein